jgi:hypothetical protein
VAERISAYGEAGVGRLLLSPLTDGGDEHLEMLERIAREVIPVCRS